MIAPLTTEQQRWVDTTLNAMTIPPSGGATLMRLQPPLDHRRVTRTHIELATIIGQATAAEAPYSDSPASQRTAVKAWLGEIVDKRMPLRFTPVC